MSKTFIYLGNNEAIEDDRVFVHGASRIKVHPDLAKTLKEGQEIVGGKDCIIEDQFWTGSSWWPTKHLIDGKTKKGTKVRTIALPLLTPPEEERNEAIDWKSRYSLAAEELARCREALGESLELLKVIKLGIPEDHHVNTTILYHIEKLSSALSSLPGKQEDEIEGQDELWTQAITEFLNNEDEPDIEFMKSKYIIHKK